MEQGFGVAIDDIADNSGYSPEAGAGSGPASDAGSGSRPG
ncbi:hypothetical protein ABZ590_38370 [Streptomyces hirsutus]